MARFLDSFVDKVRENNLLLLYAQVFQDGRVLDRTSRFGRISTGLTAFSGVSRFESYSLAKSFASIGIGIAMDEGLLTLDEKLAASFPELTYDVNNPYALNITVEDLLKMASGMAEPMLFRDSPERAAVRDWARYFYKQGQFIQPSGQTFLYSNVNTYMLGCLLEKKAGLNLLEYLRFRLFEPLGIGNPDMTQCPMKHTVAANGLAINIDELSRFGQMLLQRGRYNGKQLVSEDYLARALSPQIATRVPQYWPSQNEFLDYGYQFWIDPGNQLYFAYGVLGQICVVIPQKQAVVTMQALEEQERLLCRLLWEHVIKKL